jgi:hypothetical protein
MRLHRLLLALTLVLAVLLPVVSTMAQQPLTPLEEKLEVPYVPTHEKVVAEMLKVAEVGENDILYDLGSGDGRIVITAAKESTCRWRRLCKSRNQSQRRNLRQHKHEDKCQRYYKWSLLQGWRRSPG